MSHAHAHFLHLPADVLPKTAPTVMSFFYTPRGIAHHADAAFLSSLLPAQARHTDEHIDPHARGERRGRTVLRRTTDSMPSMASVSVAHVMRRCRSGAPRMLLLFQRVPYAQAIRHHAAILPFRWRRYFASRSFSPRCLISATPMMPRSSPIPSLQLLPRCPR